MKRYEIHARVTQVYKITVDAEDEEQAEARLYEEDLSYLLPFNCHLEIDETREIEIDETQATFTAKEFIE